MGSSKFVNILTFVPAILLGGLLAVKDATADGMSPAISLETTWKYIPADSDVVVWFDMQTLRTSELTKSVLALVEARKGHRKTYREATGVPVEMMAGLVIASRLSGDKEWVMSWLIRLNRPVRVEELLANMEETPSAREKKMRARKIGSYDVYNSADPDSDELCLLNDRLVLLTTAGAMRPILTRSKSQPPEFFGKASQQIQLSSTICAVAEVSTITKHLVSEISRDVRVDLASLQVDVGDTVDVKLVLGCHNKDEAEKVLSLVPIMLNVVKSADEEAELSDIAKTIKSSGMDTEVVITSTAKSELWNRIFKKAREMTEIEKRHEK